MKKVLIITYYWPPAGGPGVQRWLKFVKYLPEFGVQPVVLTVDAKLATYPLLDESLVQEISDNLEVYRTKTFEPFGAYQKATGRKEVPFSGFANESSKPGPRQKIAKFIRGNFFLPDARRGWNKYALKKARELLKTGNFHAIVTTGPPHSTHLIGRALKRELGIKWLADFRDPWTDIYYYDALYPTKLAKAIDRKMESDVLLSADVIISVSPDMQRILLQKSSKLAPEKFAMLPNGYDEEDFSDLEQIQNDVFTVAYTGTLTQQYKTEVFFKTLDKLAERQKIKFVIAGKFDEVVAQQFTQLKYLEIVKRGYVSHKEAIGILQRADLLLLSIPDLPDNKGILTGKLFEYLASGKRKLCLGPEDGDAAQIIKNAISGTTRHYNDAASIENDLIGAIDSWKRNKTFEANKSYVKQFSRRAITEKLSRFIL